MTIEGRNGTAARVVKKLKRRFEPMKSWFCLACEFVLWADADAGSDQSEATTHQN